MKEIKRWLEVACLIVTIIGGLLTAFKSHLEVKILQANKKTASSQSRSHNSEFRER